MFLHSGLFWFIIGILSALVALGFKTFVDERGWSMSWWKWLLAAVWYAVLAITLLLFGTLIGENETGAAWRIGVLGVCISLVLGIGLWRVLASKPKTATAPETTMAKAS